MPPRSNARLDRADVALLAASLCVAAFAWSGAPEWLAASAPGAIASRAARHLPALKLGATLLAVIGASLALFSPGEWRDAAWRESAARALFRAAGRWPSWGLALLGVAMSFAARGYDYLNNDQQTYFAVYRKMAEPALYPGDAIFDTQLYHVTRITLASKLLAGAIEGAGPERAWIAFLVLHAALLWLLWLAAISWIDAATGGDRSVRLWLFALACLGEHVTFQARLYDSALMTRLFATVASLGAMAALARDRAALGGGLAGLAVWLHPPSGLTCAAAAVAAPALKGRWRDAALSALCVVGCAAPFLVAQARLSLSGQLPAAAPSPPERAFWFLGSAFWTRNEGLVAFAAFAWLGIARARREGAWRQGGVYVSLVAMGICLAQFAAYAAVALVAPNLFEAAQMSLRGLFLFGWGALVMGAWGSLPHLRDAERPFWRRAAFAAAMLALARADGALWALLAFAGLLMAARSPEERWSRGLAIGAAALAWLLAARLALLGVEEFRFAPRGDDRDAPLIELQRWTRGNAPFDAVVLAPPDRLSWRFLGERSVVHHRTDVNVMMQGADYKPLYEERKAALEGLDWGSLSPEELDALARRFGAALVVRKARADEPEPPLASAPEGWAIFAVEPAGSAE